MRRTLAAAVLAVATASLALPAAPTAADPGGVKPTLPTLPDQAAERALEVATRVLEGEPAQGESPAQAALPDRDATLALTDLRLALPDLTGVDRQRAEALLARPSDPGGDDTGYGIVEYTVPEETPLCGSDICVRYVGSTADAPPAGWAQTTLDEMEAVWQKEVVTMGYKAPLGDGNKGGNAKLDVYLADVGDLGLYGYCAPETQVFSYTYSGYCVLDNDFAPSQFNNAAAADSLAVTAAHEFFHAIQFAYDAAEDGWFKESTATWMEERYADAVNDNRQYLRYGQVAKPKTSLDTFGGGTHYGNWAFWEYLTQRKGNGLVKAVWVKAAAYAGAPDQYSAQALKSVLNNRGGFLTNLGQYSSALAHPAKGWAEGSQWSSLKLGKPYTTTTLRTSKRKASGSTRLNHLTSKSARFRPNSTLKGKAWKLKVRVNGPVKRTAPVAYVATQLKSGRLVTSRISLNRKGDGGKTVSFDHRKVSYVTVTMVNASTRFTCWYSQYSPYSCLGNPKDQRQPYAYAVQVKRS